MSELIFQRKWSGAQADVNRRKATLQDNRLAVQAKSLEDVRMAQLKQKFNNTGLPDNLKHGIESLSGMSMDNVKVHYNSSKPSQLNAHAYAQGTDIHVAPGQEKHLPHEAWHVVQQAEGRVKPTKQMKGGVPVNDNAGLEREADVMGQQASNVGQRVVQKVRSEGETQMGSVATTRELQGVVQTRGGHRTSYYVVNINGTNYYRANVRGHQAQQAVVQAALAAAGAPANAIRRLGASNRAPANGIAV